MDPHKLLFNALIVGPTNSDKTQFLVNQLCVPFHGKFDYIALICPTFAHNKTMYRFGEDDPRMFVIVCAQHEVEIWLNILSRIFEGLNTLIVIDDCAASKDVKWRTAQLVNLGFSARHIGHIRRLRGRTLHGRIQKADTKSKSFPILCSRFGTHMAWSFRIFFVFK